MNHIYQPSLSALDSTLFQLNCNNTQKAVFLEQSLKKSQRLLSEVRFQQNHIKSQLTELNEHHQHKYCKFMKRQEELQNQIQDHQSFVTINHLKYALESNNWNQMVGYFLNPLAALQSLGLELEQTMQEQILLKHSEQKLITLQRTISTDNKINQLKEQIMMIGEDMNGKSEQIGGLLMEYEELEEILEKWKSENGCNTDSLSKIFYLKKQLNELRMNYLQLGNERQENESLFKDISEEVNKLQQNLNLLRKEESFPKLDDNLDKQIGKNISFWLSPEMVYSFILKCDNKIQNTVFVLHEKIVNCCTSLLNKNIPFEERQKKFDLNYQEVNRIMRVDEQFSQLDGDEFERLLSQKNHQELLKFIENKSQRFQIILARQIKLSNQTQNHNDLKSKQIEIERKIHKTLYDQSMIQCNYQRLEQQLQQQRINGPLLIMNAQTYQLEQILDRMSEIEFIKKRNGQQVELVYPQQIAQIQKQIMVIQNTLKTQVNDLLYQTQIEQNYFLDIIKQNQIETKFKLPQLSLDSNPFEDSDLLKIELNENREQQKQQEQLYYQQLQNLQTKLQQFEEEEISMIQKVDTIKMAIDDCKKNNLPFEQKKENIPPSRRTSLATQEHSILGTVHIELSQERTTQKPNNNNRNHIHLQNELTDRSLSKSRSKSQINNTSMTKIVDQSTISNNHFLSFQSPQQSIRKTKLTLVDNTIKTNLSSQMSQKNPILSPNSIFGGHSSQRFLEIDQSISMHSSARKIQEDSYRLSGGRNLQFQQFKSYSQLGEQQHQPQQQQQQQQQQNKIYKVYKRITSTRMVRKMSLGQQVNNYIPKFVKYNVKLKQIEFYNSNRMIQDLGTKDMAIYLKQILSISSIYEVKGIIKANFTFSGISILISRNQKMELLFGKHSEAEEFLAVLN